MDWKDVVEIMWLSEDKFRQSPQRFQDILELRETVYYLVRAKIEFRANWVGYYTNEIGVTTIPKNSFYLACKLENSFVALYNSAKIYILTDVEAKEKLIYLSDKPVDQKKAQKKIKEKETLNLRDFI